MTQSQLPDQRIYNPVPSKTDEVFWPFSRLPGEIRCAVWKESLTRERLLHIKLFHHFSIDTYEASHENKTGYTLVLIGRHPISKLFRITRESRDVAQSFYRVQLPCVYRWHTGDANGTFYFHPELDILKLDTALFRTDWAQMRQSAPEYFAEFAHQAWLNDRRNIGILNLALEYVPRHGVQFEARLTQEHTTHLLRDTIQRLKCVYFVSCVGMSEESEPAATGLTKCMRPHPVMIYTNSFTRLSQDLRFPDLKRVWLGLEDPRGDIEAWYRMLYRLQITADIDHRCILAREMKVPPVVHNFATALDWIGTGDKMSEYRRQFKHTWIPLRQEVCQTTFGFWILPIQAFKANINAEMSLCEPQGVRTCFCGVDVSGFQPELCLFNL